MIALLRIVLSPSFLLTLLFLFPVVVTAQTLSTQPSYQDISKKAQGLKPQYSGDTKPIEFDIGGVHYKVARNYIIHMDTYSGGPQELVTFKVTFPGFEPLTDNTKQCLTQPRAYWPAGCVPVEFWITRGGPLSDDDHFKNARTRFSNHAPRRGPAGFEEYVAGPENAPNQTLFRKTTSLHTLLIDCLYYSQRGKRDAVCENYGSPIAHGRNSLSYRLDLNQIDQAQNIDDGIRSLVDSFTVKGQRP